MALFRLESGMPSKTIGGIVYEYYGTYLDTNSELDGIPAMEETVEIYKRSDPKTVSKVFKGKLEGKGVLRLYFGRKASCE